MRTYNDFLEINLEDESKKMQFVKDAIVDHENTKLFKTAKLADEYMKHKNHTICEYQKLLYTVSGVAVPDNFSANYKLSNGFFPRFIIQENQYLLGNGISWGDESTKDKLGNDFDIRLQEAGKLALAEGVSFCFMNKDHLNVFSVKEFVPLYDEENGALMAGIRYWRLDPAKPLRATLYELDGYTEYVWGRRDKEGETVKINGAEILRSKRPYKIKVRKSDIDGTEIYDGENYPEFPIVPLWGTTTHQSRLVGLQEQIDCYDLIKSGFANTVDEASFIYWTIQNAGGMDDMDLAKFIEHMKTVHAAVVDDEGASAESHSIEAPYASREALLDRLRSDLYEDAMALDTKNMADGVVTATQIKAAYEPLNSLTDEYEYCIHECLMGILSVLGIEDEATFTRSMIVNAQEMVQVVLQASQYLEDDYVTTKLLTLLGDGDMAEDMLKRIDADAIDRFTEEETQEEEQTQEQSQEELN